MNNKEQGINFFLTLGKTQAAVSRRLDRGLGGVGFSEFLILYHLSRAEGKKLPRVDLAEKVGLTASGVTRLLLPMEKIGLVRRESNPDDARISLVAIAKGGKTKLAEAIERLEALSDDLFPPKAAGKLEIATELLSDLGTKIS